MIGGCQINTMNITEMAAQLNKLQFSIQFTNEINQAKKLAWINWIWWDWMELNEFVLIAATFPNYYNSKLS